VLNLVVFGMQAGRSILVHLPLKNFQIAALCLEVGVIQFPMKKMDDLVMPNPYFETTFTRKVIP
jgi:hypothetical protein